MGSIALFSAMALAVMQAALPAHAQEFPGKQPIRIIVPFLPGAANDTLARITAAALTPRLGQSVVVENKAGAGSAIGTEFVAKSPADGYTLSVGGRRRHVGASGGEAEPALQGPGRFHVHLRVLRDFLHARAQQRSARQDIAGVRCVCQGQSGQAPLRHLRHREHCAHRLRAAGKDGRESRCCTCLTRACRPWSTIFLAATSTWRWSHRRRSPLKPTRTRSGSLRLRGHAALRCFRICRRLKESGLPEVVVETWFGVAGPANLPASLTTRLQNEIGAVLKDPEVIAKLKSADFEPYFVPSEAFRKYVVDDLNKWKSVAQSEKIVITD